MFALVLASCVSGAVPVVGGGSSDPSVSRSPGVSPQKGRAAPWAFNKSPETLFGFCLARFSVIGFGVGFLFGLFVSGVGFL